MTINTTNKFELLARWGYGARGAVYMLLGAIALSGAVSGGSGAEASPEGALTTILRQPFGRILLGAVAIGLLGHVLWRLAQAILNADHQPGNAKGYVARIGNLASALTNGALAASAAFLALRMGGGGGSGGEDSVAAWLMKQPFGPWLVGLLGAAVIAAGAVQFWRGISQGYRKRIDLPPRHAGTLGFICGFALVARGVLLAVTGGFFIYAALAIDPAQAGSLTDALDWLRGLPFGFALYALAALGLVAFGLYSFIEARYRRVDAPEIGRGTFKAMPGQTRTIL